MSWAGSPAFRKRCGRSQPKHCSHSPFDLIQPRNFLEPALTGHTRFGFYILRFPNILYLFQLEPPAFRNTAGGSNFYQKAVNSSKNEDVLAWNGEILVNLAIVEKIFK